MSEDILLLLIVVFIVAPVLYFAFVWLIPVWINDNKWETYMTAWDTWEANGHKGKMPVPEDYGYKSKLY